MFQPAVLARRLNRREALAGLGAAAAAVAALRPARALAAPTAFFELDLGDHGTARAAAPGGWRTTRPLPAPARFDLAGLAWEGEASLEAELRVRRRGGPWSRWVALLPLVDHAPDRAAPRGGTEPAWTGPADELQLRLRGRARGLRARFVRTRPTALATRRLARRLGPRARASASGPPPIIPRAAWGAELVPPRRAPSYGQVQLAFVHHTATANAYGPGDSAAIVLGIARYHRDGNGWNDVGYNFLVDAYGQVFEGRAGGIDQPVIGAQAQGFNTASTGIAVLGDLSAVAASPPAFEALAQLIGWKLSLHGVPVEGQVAVVSGGGATSRHPAGASVVFERISGHRDGNRTSCPGDALYAQLPPLRVRARAHATAPLAAALTLGVAAARRRGPLPATVSGELRFADGASPGGAPLGIEFQAPGTDWQPVGLAQCLPDGRWTTGVVVPRSGLVRAVFAGDPARPRLESKPVAVRVVPRLTMVLGARRATAGSRVTVGGTLEPALPLVTLTLERRLGRRWALVQRKRIAAGGARYATHVRPRRAGLYRVSVITPDATIRRLVRATGLSGGTLPSR